MKKVVNEEKKSTLKKVLLCIIVLILVVVCIVAYSYISSNFYGTNTNIKKYEQFLKNSKEHPSWTKYGMDESIWPEKISSDMNVKHYKMTFLDIIDAQFMGFLEVQYEEDDYKKELDRLKNYKSNEYIGNYGVTGFDENYSLVAMHADEVYGFVYALTDNKDTIIYVEMIYTDYFLDLNYEKGIPSEYLPVGFDASKESEYRKEKLKELEENSYNYFP